MFVAIHPSDPATLLRLPGGQALLAPAFANAVTAAISRYRLAGYDLVVRAAIYVPIELEIQPVPSERGHFRGEVLEVATNALPTCRLPGGASGFFHPLNFRFRCPGLRQPHLRPAAAGDRRGRVRHYPGDEALWNLPNGELERGVAVPMGPAEVAARLDNDSNQPEFGVPRLTAVGGT